MSISMQDIEAGKVVLAGPGEVPKPPLTPGEILRMEFLEPLGLSAYALAKALNVPPNRVTGILNGERGITAETALRLGRYFRMPGQFFVNLQTGYDLQIAASRDREALERIVPRVAAE